MIIRVCVCVCVWRTRFDLHTISIASIYYSPKGDCGFCYVLRFSSRFPSQQVEYHLILIEFDGSCSLRAFIIITIITINTINTINTIIVIE